MSIEVTNLPPSVADTKRSMLVTIDDSEFLYRRTAHAILEIIAQKVADKYVEEHYGEIAARLDQTAIANLAIADAGKKIAEEIRAKPTVIREQGTTINNYKQSIL